jgi:hypothetical protein
VTALDPDLLTSQRSTRSDAVPSAGSRVVVLYEPGRCGSAALDLARRLVADDGSALTVVTVAPQDSRICCGAGSAMDYNRAVCEAADDDLREAHELLGPVADQALMKVLVEGKDPPLVTWIAAGDFDLVLLPARRRPLRRAKHPEADELRRLTSAEVRVVDAGSSLEEPGAEALARPLTSTAPR